MAQPQHTVSDSPAGEVEGAFGVRGLPTLPEHGARDVLSVLQAGGLGVLLVGGGDGGRGGEHHGGLEDVGEQVDRSERVRRAQVDLAGAGLLQGPRDDLEARGRAVSRREGRRQCEPRAAAARQSSP